MRGVLGFLLLAAISTLAHGRAPNIIFILADDMGYGDPAYAGGKISTPHLDRMAKEGIYFTDADTSSAVCTPTRYGILTGRYNWCSPMKQGVLNGFSEALIPGSRMTVASLLGGAGYSSSVIGKWHLGLDWKKSGKPGSGKGKGWDVDYTAKIGGGPTALGFTSDNGRSPMVDIPDLGETRNLAEKEPARVKEMADLLAMKIRDGRSTPGPKQENDGWPDTTPAVVLELLPQLKP